jgi:cysteine desulfurase/selenocysteine lyase
VAWLARLANELFSKAPGGALPVPVPPAFGVVAHPALGSPSPTADTVPALALSPALANGVPVVNAALPVSSTALAQRQPAPAVGPDGVREDDLRDLLHSLGSALAFVPPAQTAPRSSGVGAIAPQLGEVERNVGISANRRVESVPPDFAPSAPLSQPPQDARRVFGAPTVSPTAPREPALEELPPKPGIASVTSPFSLPQASSDFQMPQVPSLGPKAPYLGTHSLATTSPDASAVLPEPARRGTTDAERLPGTESLAPPSSPEMGAAPAAPLPPAASTSLARPTSAVPAPNLADPFGWSPVPGAASAPHVPLVPHGGVDPATALDAARTAAGSFPGAGIAGPKDARAPERALLEPFAFQPDMLPAPASTRRILDPHAVRREFPILAERVHGKPLVWFDNAATTQKPRAVIERIRQFYEHENSNIHRAAHALAARATDAYEGAREKVRRFLNAGSEREIVFVRGATEGLNLVAKSIARRRVQAGDEIVLTWLEHHANIVPWQQLCAETGAKLRVAPVDDDGQIVLEEFEKLLNSRTQVVSMTHVSNALGTITPLRQMIALAHRHGALAVVDAAQSVSHMRVDVQALDCDVLVFSGHKRFAPTGIGAVWARLDLLENSPPWQGGGNMIADVRFERTIYQPPPARFEAGTGNIADAVGLGAAIDYLEDLGMDAIGAYEHDLLVYATERLREVPRLRLIGTAREKASVLSFVMGDLPTEQVGAALDKEGIAVRSGHHCAQPILRRFGLESTVRPSLAFYNTREEVDLLVRTLLRIESDARAQGR